MNVWGPRAKETKQAGQRGTCQHIQPASVIHLGNDMEYSSIQQAAHGGQQAGHSLAAESGGVQMNVWGRRAKETKQAGQRGTC